VRCKRRREVVRCAGVVRKRCDLSFFFFQRKATRCECVDGEVCVCEARRHDARARVPTIRRRATAARLATLPAAKMMLLLKMFAAAADSAAYAGMRLQRGACAMLKALTICARKSAAVQCV